MEHTATYSPEDNKLRLYPAHRLDPDEYARVKAAGFSWAPKQELFVAPMWTPNREDLLLEMCGEIGDEDTSLVDRAEAKAERLEDLSDRKLSEAHHARAAVAAIADNIPLGQPILVGHHSEKHARKDAERIENGMRKAVDCWKAATYWTDRANAAIRHAKFKERPDVRARRIKGLEADYRSHDRDLIEGRRQLKVWDIEPLTWIYAKRATNDSRMHCSQCFPLAEYPRPAGASQYEGAMGLWSALGDTPETAIITPEQARELGRRSARGMIDSAERWLAHIDNRLAYERAMLAEGGGLIAEQHDIQVGGRVLIRGEWVSVLRINRKGGKILSVRTNCKYVPVRSIEEIGGYDAPSAEEAAKVAAAMQKGPLCNYPGERFAACTQAEWDAIDRDHKSTTRAIVATEATAAHRVRTAIGYRVHLPPPQGKELETHYCNANRTHTYWPVFITDAKRTDPPAPGAPVAKVAAPRKAAPAPRMVARAERDAAAAPFLALQEQLKTGVQVVIAPQLFPTPPELARRVVREADIQPGDRVLEPEAGTGALAAIVREVIAHHTAQADAPPELICVELNHGLVERLLSHGYAPVIEGDFLAQNGNLGKFDRIVMNPPFINGSDIKHIQHARGFLNSGGRLVALCANGSRQREILKPIAEASGGSWEDLPAGSFAEQGTNVNVALLVIRG